MAGSSFNLAAVLAGAGALCVAFEKRSTARIIARFPWLRYDVRASAGLVPKRISVQRLYWRCQLEGLHVGNISMSIPKLYAFREIEANALLRLDAALPPGLFKKTGIFSECCLGGMLCCL